MPLKVSRGALSISVLLAGLVVLAVGHGQATPGKPAPGQLDPTFGQRGQVITGSFAGFGAQAVAIQRDGTIVAAGDDGRRFMLVRYKKGGSLDPRFGSQGRVRTSFGPLLGFAWSLALQRDGKIIAAGHAWNMESGYFALARYNSNGSLDRSFGSGGTVTTSFGSGSATAYAVALQPDGRIVAAGTFSHEDDNHSDFAVARYRSNGTPDPSFGSGGLVTTPIGGFARALALQRDGKIIVAGSSKEGSRAFALVRYRSNGSLDPNFGAGGIVTTAFGSLDGALAVVLQRNGKIVVVGGSQRNKRGLFALVRYKPNGSLDRSFGSGGKVRTSFGSGSAGPEAAALQRDGKIVVVGWMSRYPKWEFALARYRANGSLDPSFGTGGKLTTSFRKVARTPRGRLREDGADAVAIQRDGRIVVAGAGQVRPTFSRAPNAYKFELARYIGGSGESTR
jgi:uncharacterized delta-60 repeat protein